MNVIRWLKDNLAIFSLSNRNELQLHSSLPGWLQKELTVPLQFYSSPVVLMTSWAQSSIRNQQCPLGRDRECFLDARVAINFLPLTYCKSTRSWILWLLLSYTAKVITSKVSRWIFPKELRILLIHLLITVKTEYQRILMIQFSCFRGALFLCSISVILIWRHKSTL